jgi:hypothetical protein
MKTKKRLRYLLIALLAVLLPWAGLTVYVERQGPAQEWELGNDGRYEVLIVFDPDPFYNLDEKVCRSFANGLVQNGLSVKIATVAAAEAIDQREFQTFVYCANTYNWRPDWAVTGFIKTNIASNSRSAVTITLGAGSTESSRKHLDELVKESGSTLLNSYSLWLWRPNDESKPEQPNVALAESMAYAWGVEIGDQLSKMP